MSTRAEEERLVKSVVPVMLGKLRANATKTHWKSGVFTPKDRHDRAAELLELVKKEIRELEAEIIEAQLSVTEIKNAPKIRSEVADAMNLLAMIADVVGTDSDDV